MTKKLFPVFLILFLSALFCVSAIAETVQWQPVSPQDTRPPASGVWIDSTVQFNGLATSEDGSLALLVGKHGVIYRRDQNGRWQREINPLPTIALKGVAMSSDGSIAFAVGDGGIILSRSQNGSWDIEKPAMSNEWLTSVATSPDGKFTLAVGSAVSLDPQTALIARRLEDGSWTRENAPAAPAGVTLETVAVTADGTMAFAAGTTLDSNGNNLGTILQRASDGSWMADSIPAVMENVRSVAVSNDGQLAFAGGDDGTVPGDGVLLRLVSGNWIVETIPTGIDPITSVAISVDKKTALAVCDDGTLLQWNGLDGWSELQYPGMAAPTTVALSRDAALRLIVGSRGEVMSLSAGTAWRQEIPPAGQGVPFDASASSDGRLILGLGTHGQLLRRTIDGSWVTETVPDETGRFFTGVTVSQDGTDAFAFDSSGEIWRRDSAGNWTGETFAPRILHGALRHIVTSHDGTVTLALANSGESEFDDGTLPQILSRGSNGLWQEEALPQGVKNLYAIAISPDGSQAFAVGEHGQIVRRSNTGVWTIEVPSSPGSVSLYDVLALADGSVFAVGAKSFVLKRSPTGDWQPVNSLLGTDFQFKRIVVSPDGKTLLALRSDHKLFRSTDGGISWTADDFGGIEGDFRNPIMLPNNRAILFGNYGGFFELQSIRSGTAASDIGFSHHGKSLTFFWRYPPGHNPVCSAVAEWLNENARSPLSEVPHLAAAGDPSRTAYKITWTPSVEARNSGAGADFRYSVQCVDDVLGTSWIEVFRGPAEGQSLVTPINYHQLAMEWLSKQSDLTKGVLASVASLLIVALILATLWIAAPRALVPLHETISPTFSFGETLPWLPKAFGYQLISALRGAIQLLFFFATTRRALDAWVASKSFDAYNIFSNRPAVHDRLITLDLPVTLTMPGLASPVDLPAPWQKAFEQFNRATSTILIAGPGGAGKTTVAFELARLALGKNSKAESLAYRMLPILIDFDLKEPNSTADDLLNAMSGLLRLTYGGSSPVSAKLTKALLRKGRILLIVDGLSERSIATRQALDPRNPGFLPRHMIVTSRNPALDGATAIFSVQGIPALALPDFISRYLRAKFIDDGATKISESDILISSGHLQKMLRGHSTTPLLATMWATEMAERSGPEGTVQNVADLMDRYIRRILFPSTGGSETLFHQLREDCASIAERELGNVFQPGLISLTLCARILNENSPAYVDFRLQALLQSRLLEPPFADSDDVRVVPDPIAEHLAAWRLRERLDDNLEGWKRLILQLSVLQSIDGFALALERCVQHRSYGTGVPQQIAEIFSNWLGLQHTDDLNTTRQS